MKYKEIAEKYGISLSTVKSWAVRYWKKNELEKVATNEEKVATTTAKKLQPEKNKGGAPKGNYLSFYQSKNRNFFYNEKQMKQKNVKK